MRYTAEETAQKHAKVLREASHLFRSRGFDGASISQIMTATGLTHGSFYNHFESKEDLLAESYAEASSELLTMFDLFERSPTGKRAMFGFYLNAAHRDDRAGGCIMAALATDFSNHPKARAVMTQHIRSVIDGIANKFPWSPRRTRRKQATQALALMVGGLILSRVVDDPALSDALLRDTLDALSI